MKVLVKLCTKTLKTPNQLSRNMWKSPLKVIQFKFKAKINLLFFSNFLVYFFFFSSQFVLKIIIFLSSSRYFLACIISELIYTKLWNNGSRNQKERSGNCEKSGSLLELRRISHITFGINFPSRHLKGQIVVIVFIFLHLLPTFWLPIRLNVERM